MSNDFGMEHEDRAKADKYIRLAPTLAGALRDAKPIIDDMVNGKIGWSPSDMEHANTVLARIKAALKEWKKP